MRCWPQAGSGLYIEYCFLNAIIRSPMKHCCIQFVCMNPMFALFPCPCPPPPSLQRIF